MYIDILREVANSGVESLSPVLAQFYFALAVEKAESEKQDKKE